MADPLLIAGIGAAGNILGGLFGGGGGPELTEEEQRLLEQSFRQQAQLQGLLGTDIGQALQGPLGLSRLAGRLEGFGRGGEVATARAATQREFDFAGGELGRQLDVLRERVQLDRGRALRDIRGALGAAGVRGGARAPRLAEAIQSGEIAVQDLIGRGQAQLGQLGVAGARAQLGAEIAARNRALQAEGLLGNLRGLANQNLSQFLANPLANSLMSQFQQQAQNAQPNPFAQAFGSIGGSLLQGGLDAFLQQQFPGSTGTRPAGSTVGSVSQGGIY